MKTILMKIVRQTLMIEDIKLIFNRYKLIESHQDLEIYIGKNERGQDSLLFIINKPFPTDLVSELTNTGMLTVFLLTRKDGKTIISFDLQDVSLNSLFESFTQNLIHFVCSPTNLVKPFESIALRYEQWKKLLKANKSGVLSISAIRGLIGELLFLKDYLIPQFGGKIALSFWTGPDGSDQDFKTDRTWYEIKTIHSGQDTVTISSVEQLDTERFGSGNLVVFALDATVSADPHAITIKSIISSIKKSLTEQEAFLFDNILFSSMNYYDRPEYETKDYIVRQSSIDFYKISNDTPVIRKNNIPDTVVSLEYKLSLIGLKAFHQKL